MINPSHFNRRIGERVVRDRLGRQETPFGLSFGPAPDPVASKVLFPLAFQLREMKPRPETGTTSTGERARTRPGA